MEPRLILPLHWFTVPHGPDQEVLVRQTQPEQPPEILCGPMPFTGKGPHMAFPLTSLFEPKVVDHDIKQVWGDGPEAMTLPASAVEEVAKRALMALHPAMGKLRVVWVPDDPRLPF